MWCWEIPEWWRKASYGKTGNFLETLHWSGSHMKQNVIIIFKETNGVNDYRCILAPEDYPESL